MTLVELLENSSEKVVKDSVETMRRVNVKHYSFNGPESLRKKIYLLYDHVFQSVIHKNVVPFVSYVQKMAAQRFESGFELQEVQTVLNVLEESLWREVLYQMPREDQLKALGLISSIVGSGKDALARTYVNLAQEKIPA